MKESTKKIFHWERDFGKKMIRIALPIALQNLVAASAHIVDGLMVAGLQDNGAAMPLSPRRADIPSCFSCSCLALRPVLLFLFPSSGGKRIGKVSTR